MPANYTYEFAKAMQEYEHANSLEEKLKALKLMKQTAPSHKGAENLRLDISKKIGKIKEKMRLEKQRKGSRKIITVKKEGVAQIVLVGLPNSGKSTILNTITNTNVEVNDYAFTTTKPEIGVMNYKGSNIQVVEIPALIKNSYLGKAQGREKLSLIRNGDLILFCFIGNKDKVKKDYELLLNELNSGYIFVNRKKPNIIVKKLPNTEIEIINTNYLEVDEKETIRFLKSLGVSGVTIILNENTNLDDLKEIFNQKITYKNAIGVWVYGENDFKYKDLNLIAFNPKNPDINYIHNFEEKIYNTIGLIRVFTKKTNGKKNADNLPFILLKGADIEDLCFHLHKDFVENFSYAKVWGSGKYPGQKVSKDFVLSENDIVQIFLKK